ncbi:guanine nucleotide binding protein, alpha subunit [Globomyces pollinis-pini]|nr:guanine nucleotide binding protein, alpha subunit [Globomyces pollinis-pini]
MSFGKKIDAQMALELEEARKVEDYLKAERKKYEQLQSEPKLLILGSSDSGKSTLLKQLKILYSNGFTSEETKIAKQQIINNILGICSQLLSETQPDLQNKYKPLLEYTNDNDQSKEFIQDPLIDLITNLWVDPLIQNVYSGLSSKIPQTTPHFFDNLSRLVKLDSIPTNEDILLVRTVTPSISDTVFEIENLRFHFYDVSGLKHHRKQWISYFEDVMNIVFIVALNSYDQMMIEDPTTNRMVDALQLYDKIVNHPLLVKPDMILFFNKKDLFEKKIVSVPVKDHFSDYDGPESSPKLAYQFFQQKFSDLNKCKTKSVFYFLTCCTDTKFMKSIVESVISSVLKRNMQHLGMS